MSKHEYSYLYKQYRWQKLRKAHMDQHPLCVMCEQQGKIVLAKICDHITPHKGDEYKFFNSPLQSLCKLHHDSTKQRMEARSIEIGGDANGNPIDPKHHWNIK